MEIFVGGLKNRTARCLRIIFAGVHVFEGPTPHRSANQVSGIRDEALPVVFTFLLSSLHGLLNSNWRRTEGDQKGGHIL